MIPSLLFLLASAAAAAPSKRADGETLFLAGTGSIMMATFDGREFKITKNETAPGAPTWLAHRGDRVYAVDEWSNSTSMFHLDASKNFTAKGTVIGSTGVVHLALDKDGKRMLGSAYGSGTIDVFDTSSDSEIKVIKTVKSEGGPGPDKERQAKPHPHQAVLDPTGRFFAVNDLGTDRILVLDSEKEFDVVNSVEVKPAGCGPRHGAFYPVGGSGPATHYIVVCEIMNLVNVYALKYGDKGINLTERQSLSTFAKDKAPKKAAAGALVISPDDKDVYVSNRRLEGGEMDDIAHFRITKSACKNNATGLRLELADNVSTSGKKPRMISLSRDGRTVFVANSEGENAVVALKRNEDGTLAETPLGIIKNTTFPANGAPAYIHPVE